MDLPASVSGHTLLMTSILAKLHNRSTTFESRHEISNNVVCATSIDSDQPAHMGSLIRAFAGRLKIL